MKDINQLFFELIRVAIGNQVYLSHTPSADEWNGLYALAKKQALVGICFAGAQKLSINHPSSITNLSESLRLQWMGIAAKIQQRNEFLAYKGKELLSALQAEGIEACILKGQALTPYYDNVGVLRQSGDIDIWTKDQYIKSLVDYVKRSHEDYVVKYVHVGYDYDGVEVELHPRPASLRCPWYDLKLRSWFEKYPWVSFSKANNIISPSTEFNLVFLMLHMYNHVMKEGVGLRQVMDYYFVLKSANIEQRRDALAVLRSVGVGRFAESVMYILREVFSLDDEKLLCIADSKSGALLLAEIMNGGNFGFFDTKHSELKSDNLFVHGYGGLKKKFSMIRFGPWEVLCSPMWSVWQVCWRKYHGYM